MIENEELGLKIGTKEEDFWDEIKTDTEKDIERLNKMLKFNYAIVAMCEEKLKGGDENGSDTETN